MTELQLNQVIKTYKNMDTKELEKTSRILTRDLRRNEDVIRAIKEELEKRRAI